MINERTLSRPRGAIQKTCAELSADSMMVLVVPDVYLLIELFDPCHTSCHTSCHAMPHAPADKALDDPRRMLRGRTPVPSYGMLWCDMA